MIHKIKLSITALALSLNAQAQTPGNTLHFDGQNDYVSIPYDGTFNQNAFTFSVWVRPEESKDWRAIINSRTDMDETRGFIVYLNPQNEWEFWTGNGTTTGWNYLNSYQQAQWGQWTHLAGSYDGHTMHFYINGKEAGALACSMVPNLQNELRIGAGGRANPEMFYRGSIDELHLWRKALPEEGIRKFMFAPNNKDKEHVISISFNEGKAEGDNTSLSTLHNEGTTTLNGQLHGFSLNGKTSNFIESYAMVVPQPLPSVGLTEYGFQAQWKAPVIGQVDTYLLDVAEDADFTHYLPGYHKKDVGPTTSHMVPHPSRCFYRVYAEKKSVSGQGVASDAIEHDRIVFTHAPKKGELYAANEKGTCSVLLEGYTPLSKVDSFEYQLLQGKEIINIQRSAALYEKGEALFNHSFTLKQSTVPYSIALYHHSNNCWERDTVFSHLRCQGDLKYSVPEKWWEESYGNHRAVLQIKNPAEAIRIQFLWRRHDVNPAEHQLVLVDSEQNQTIKQIYRNTVDNERCDIVAGPFNKAGEYHLYYLPYRPDVTIGGSFTGGYTGRESKPSSSWVKQNNLADLDAIESLPQAEIVAIQARTRKDSFYPMELIPTEHEKRDFLAGHPNNYLVFPEDRDHKIIMRDNLVYKWIKNDPATTLKMKADQNEYYCYQLGVYANKKNLKNVRLRFEDLKSESGDIISVDQMTCFNTEGINPKGQHFTKTVHVPLNHVQPLWVGLDLDTHQKPGKYEGCVYVVAEDEAETKIDIQLTVTNQYSADRGDDTPEKYSRLRWLNSTLGLNQNTTGDYATITKQGDQVFNISGRKIELNKLGLPTNITAGNTDILNSDIKFIIETSRGIEDFSNVQLVKEELHSGIATRTYNLENDNFLVKLDVSIESDGYCRFSHAITAKTALEIKDIRLELPIKVSVAEYMMGFGQKGCKVPRTLNNKKIRWNKNHQTFWVGNTNGGIFCRLLGASYTGPLLNVYAKESPSSWYNNNRGGVCYNKKDDHFEVSAYSGQRSLDAGEQLTYDYALLVTPVKTLDTKAMFTDRYYHGLDDASIYPSQRYQDLGVKVINYHHANKVNPYINYPFITADIIREQARYWHKRGIKVKLYFTVRELTYFVSEIWALRSLGNEIIAEGNGGGYPWLREHLINDYTPQWYVHRDLSLPADAAFLTSTGETRWYNYYVEALRYMVDKLEIDGIYLDDVAFDREIVKRMRKVMDSVKQGCLIDLHSNNDFSLGPATQYTEYFPYINKLWFGEHFYYNEIGPDFWLTEISGIPFGLSCDQIYSNNNLQCGMLYGSVSRAPSSDKLPDEIWNIWNKFGIADAEMIGYWDSRKVVTSNKTNVLATTYKKKGSSMIAIANFDQRKNYATVNINLSELGLDPNKLEISIPEIKEYQHKSEINQRNGLMFEPKGGYLIFLKEKETPSAIEQVSSEYQLRIKPNPVHNVANVFYKQIKEGTTQIKVYDMKGKLIHSVLNQTQKSGNYLVHIPMMNQTAGTYIIVRHENGCKVDSLVFQKK